MSSLKRNLKKLIAVLCLGVTFLLSGLFFAGCGGSDLENLTLSSNYTSISLYKGESKNIQFTIGNYNDNIDNSLSFSLVDSASSTSSSEHVGLKVISQQGATTTVQLTGLSGGSTTLIAMTNEGAKTCKVDIEVFQYSSSISLKNNQALYVSKNQAFVPSSEMFDFDSNSTEKELTFHFTDKVENVGDNNRFAKVMLDEANTLHFYYENGEENTEIETISLAYDAQSFSAFARYNYYEYVDGTREERTIVVPFSFCALQGFEENPIKVEGAEDDKVSLVVNSKNENDRSAKLNVKIPYSAINPTIAGSIANSYVKFEYLVDDSSVLSVEKSNESYENQTISFDLTLTSSTTISQETNLELKIYYYVDGKSFDNGENSVCKTKNIVVDLNVAPMNITVNGLTDSATKPVYQLYNYYYGSNNGVELDVRVYEPNSDYAGVKVVYNTSQVQILHKGVTISSGTVIEKEDLSTPLILRGAVNSGESEGEVKFVVVSDYLEEDTVTYTAKYSVKNGARALTFADESFNYQPNSANTGVFLSNSSLGQQFSGLLADQPFSSATLSFVEGNVSALTVSYVGMGTQTGGKYPLIFNLTPRMVGDATYSVTLDNGVTKKITFRVIDTFDDLSIVLDSSKSSGVQSYEIVENDEYDVAMNLILKNETDSSGVVNYSSNAYLNFVSNTIDSFSRIDYVDTSLTNISGGGAQNSYIIGVNSFGTSQIEFNVFGTSVQDFKKIDNFEKNALIDLISYVPVSSFNMQNSQTESYSTVLDLYVGDSVTDQTLQSVSFSEVVSPNIAYGFYDPIDRQFKTENYSSRFIYWSLNGASIFKQVGASWQMTDTMVYDDLTVSSNVYRIGESVTEYYGTFDTASMTFSVNRSLNRTFSVTFYATLRQFGETRHFAVTIRGSAYDNVVGISSNYGSNIIFSAQKTSYDFGVYLNPFTATDTGITIRYVSQNIGTGENALKTLINEDEIKINETSKGIYLISIKLNSDVLNVQDVTYSGELQIIPNSWMSAGAVLPAYQNSILRFKIEFQNGTTENPYILQTAQDILAIGSSAEAMRSHYKLSTTIDVSSISNQLPLGKGMNAGGTDLAFTGSITGDGNARIVGLNIQNGNSNYGLFCELGEDAEISNITFEGKISIASVTTEANIGLLAGKSLATLDNVSARLFSSTISVGTTQVINIGGLVGQNSGDINSPNVLFEDYLNVYSRSDNVSDNVFVGGIVGDNSGSISGQESDFSKYGYSAYSVYALIHVTNMASFDETNFKSSDLKGTVGSVAGVSSGEMNYILAGGDVWAKNAGGLIGKMTGGKLINATTRTFVRGTTVGLIVSSFEGSVEIGSQKSISVEAIDNGKFKNEKASMGILYSEEAIFEDSFAEDLEGLTYDSLLFNQIFLGTGLSGLAGIPSGYLENDKAGSFVERTIISNGGANIVVTNLSLTEYYGDFVVVNDEDIATIINSVTFEKQTTSFSVAPNTTSGFRQLHQNGCSQENCTCENIVYFAYYFDAVGYYNNGEYVTGNLTDAQNSLDVLNRLKPGDALYPLVVDGNDVTVRSNSANVEITTSGEIYIKGTGLAEIEVFSLLNQNKKQTIYLNVINYFNYYAYVEELEAGIFKLGNMTLGQNAKLNVYSQKGVNIDVSPVYTLSADTFGGTRLAYGLEDGTSFNISKTGQVLLNNQVIQLASTNNFDIQISEEVLEYGNYEVSGQGVRFTKKPNISLVEGATDKFNITVSISTLVNGKGYFHAVSTLEDVTLNYNEGSKAIYSNYDAYTISSSHSIKDLVEIDSDEPEDSLIVEIYDSKDDMIDSAHPLSDLFNVDTTKKETLKFDVEISVDTDSTAFKNRLVQNIYGTYTVVYYAESNGREVAKSIKLTLVKNSVDVIVASNYPKLQDLSQESDKIVPGANGLLSVSISPVDADFESILIQNASKNSFDGAATADFTAGTINIDSDGKIVFTPITYVVVDGGIKIRQSDLASNSFNGQIYVRYIFSNKSVVDGTSVGVVITVEQEGGNFSKQFDYTLLREDAVDIQIDGYPNKKQVARGVEYKLDVKNEGYDFSTLNLISSDPSIATIDLRDDGYYLVMTNDEITDYDAYGGKDFEITVSASKLDEFGQISETSATLNLTMLEYVINIVGNSENEDLIEGMNDGVVTSAVGERTQLALNFDEMLEYNPANQSVLNSVNVFKESLKVNGTWMFYTDLNANNDQGVQIYPTPLKEAKSTSSVLSTDNSISTRYLSTSGFSFTTNVAHDPANRHYFFSYSGQYKLQHGQYVWTAKVNSEYPPKGYTEIDVDIDVYAFLRGSEESPNPVTTYDEFLNMTAGGHYILMNDINVPSQDFVPLNTEIATFDGNNHYFIFDGETYQLGSADAGGLFGTIGPNTFIKNVKVQIGGETVKSVTFNSSATTSASIGVVAGINNGSIYNAQVEMASGAKLFVTFGSDPATSGFYFGGIVGQNAGYLTNSTSKVNVQSVVTIGGVAGQNSNIIASSSFKEGMLVSTSIYLDVFNVGGFVGENTLNGKILTSFTSGYVSSERPYSLQTEDGKTSMISSSVSASSFVFNNEGEISDCYSNLPIQSGGMSAGFAFYNSGSISRSFSTSNIIRDSSANDYIFASDIVVGKFVDCYYITGENINNSLLIPSLNGVAPLKYNESGDNPTNEFSDLAGKFSSYGYSTTPSYNSVWFYSSGETSNLFNGMQFAGGRLELVSANMISNGQRVSAGITTSPDGVITYNYKTSPSSPADGSAFNPYVIHSPETMESYMSNPSNILTGYYRFACDVDYSSMPGDYSNLHNKSIKGSVDGNGMTISGIRITSSETLSSAGLFSEISGTSVNFASVSNLIIVPEIVNFANAKAVGSLAGTVRNANVFNISIKGTKSGEEADDTAEEIVTVSGKNIVGGVIGYVSDNFNIKNLNAYVGAFASYVPSKDDTNDMTSSSIDKVSYGGGLIGYVGGIGKIYDVNISRGAVNIFASKAGIAFGGIASQVSVNNVFLTINANMKIKAHSYGGIVAGELKGSLTNVYVYGTEGSFNIFDLKPYIATAVGGVVGIASDKAKIDYAYMGQSFAIENQTSASVSVNTISYVGGVVGLVNGGNISISRVIVDADITARNVLGGVVGEIAYSSQGGTSVNLSEIAVKEGTLKVEGQNTSPTLGGIIGRSSSGVTSNLTSLSIKDSYVRANLELSVYTYSLGITSNIGAIIGASTTNNITLDTIYSTTLYDISVRDLSQSGSEQQVIRKSTVHPDGTQTFEPNKYVYAGAEQSDDNYSIGGFTYKNSFSSTSSGLNVANVYNSAIWSFDDTGDKTKYNKYDYLTQGFTTIKMLKSDSQQFIIYQNEFGKSLYDYNIASLSDDESYLDRLNLEAYYGMFMTLSEKVLKTYLNDETLSDLCALLGVSARDNIEINLPNLLENAYYKFVGFTDTDKGTTRTLNFEKCDEIVWIASTTEFSKLAFENQMKI